MIPSDHSISSLQTFESPRKRRNWLSTSREPAFSKLPKNLFGKLFSFFTMKEGALIASLSKQTRSYLCNLNFMKTFSSGHLTLTNFTQNLNCNKILKVCIRHLNIKAKYSDKHIKIISTFPNVRHLILDETSNITTEGAAHLKKLKNLKKLTYNYYYTSNHDENDQILPCLSSVKTLQYLTLIHTNNNFEFPQHAIFYLSKLTNLLSLNIESYGMNDRVMAGLSKLTKLKILKLSVNDYVDDEEGKMISDIGLASLTALTQLTHLSITPHMCVTDRGLSQFKKFQNLRELSLNGGRSNVTNKGLSNLSHLVTLESLSLSSFWEITDLRSLELSNFKNLHSLNFTYNESMTETGLESIFQIENLTSLNLSECRALTDSALKGLSHLKNLTSLNLSECENLTDETLGFINTFNCIKKLDLSYTKVSFTHSLSFEKLKNLKLYGCKNLIGDSLKIIRSFKNLESLNLPGGFARAEAFIYLSDLFNLRVLTAGTRNINLESLFLLTQFNKAR